MAALVVAGHCWPLFARFRGGMGLSPAGGAFLAISPLGGAISLGVLVGLVLLYRHAARGSAMAGFQGNLFWTSVIVGWILAYRFFREDWDREYRELWLDREE